MFLQITVVFHFTVVLNFFLSLLLGFSLDNVFIAYPPSAMFMIYPSQVFSVLFFTPHPPPHTLCSVLLWACASALQTLLKSLSGSTLPSSDNPFSSVAFASSWLVLFLLDLPLMLTTLLSFFQSVFLFLLYSFICCQSLNSIIILILSFLLLAFTWCHNILQEPFAASKLHLYFGFDFVEDTKGSKWKQVVLSNFTLKAMLFCFDFFVLFLQMYVYTVGGFAFQLDLLVVIDYEWDQCWVKSGHTECGQKTIQKQMS